MKIQTERLLLRPWEAKDQAALVRYANNRKIWLGVREIFPHPYTEKDAQWWLKNFNHDENQSNFAIEYSQEAVGAISLHKLEDVYHRGAELGYWIAEPFWGQGFATEAIKAICEWGFSHLNLLRIQAGIFAGNQASIRVLEKAGFCQEACLKQAIFKDNQVLDCMLYAKLKAPSA